MNVSFQIKTTQKFMQKIQKNNTSFFASVCYISLRSQHPVHEILTASDLDSELYENPHTLILPVKRLSQSLSTISAHDSTI